MNMKKTISRITSVAILSTTLISFIPVSSYGATYYSSNSYNSSNTNYSTSYSSTNGSVTRYYSKDNNTTTNTDSSTKSNTETSKNQTTISSPKYTTSSTGRVTRYYSRNTEPNNTTNSSNTQSDNTSNSTPVDNNNSPSTVNDNISLNVDELTKKMLTLINDERTKSGLTPLILDENLTSVAKLKAKDMVENDYLSHTSATYGSIYTMIKNAGIRYYNAGENIARAFSVDSAHNNFMNSYMHKRAILADHFTHVGIGIEREKGGMYKISVMFIEAK